MSSRLPDLNRAAYGDLYQALHHRKAAEEVFEHAGSFSTWRDVQGLQAVGPARLKKLKANFSLNQRHGTWPLRGAGLTPSSSTEFRPKSRRVSLPQPAKHPGSSSFGYIAFALAVCAFAAIAIFVLQPAWAKPPPSDPNEQFIDCFPDTSKAFVEEFYLDKGRGPTNVGIFGTAKQQSSILACIKRSVKSTSLFLTSWSSVRGNVDSFSVDLAKFLGTAGRDKVVVVTQALDLSDKIDKLSYWLPVLDGNSGVHVGHDMVSSDDTLFVFIFDGAILSSTNPNEASKSFASWLASKKSHAFDEWAFVRRFHHLALSA